MTRSWHARVARSGAAPAGVAGSESGILPRLTHRARPWLAAAAAVVLLAAVLPPVATYARQYAFAQALQFTVFAVLAPALLALAMPPRIAVIRDRACQHTDAKLSPAAVAASRLVPFIMLVLTWRLPPMLDALASYPALAVAELVTLAGAGLGVWRAISGQAAPVPLPRPLRAAMAAAAMWTIWIIAYVTGMSSLALIPRNPAATEVISAAADRQLAAATLWAVPAISFAPVVYHQFITWLGEPDKQPDEQRELARPPGGWRDRGAR